MIYHLSAISCVLIPLGILATILNPFQFGLLFLNLVPRQVFKGLFNFFFFLWSTNSSWVDDEQTFILHYYFLASSFIIYILAVTPATNFFSLKGFTLLHFQCSKALSTFHVPVCDGFPTGFNGLSKSCFKLLILMIRGLN